MWSRLCLLRNGVLWARVGHRALHTLRLFPHTLSSHTLCLFSDRLCLFLLLSEQTLCYNNLLVRSVVLGYYKLPAWVNYLPHAFYRYRSVCIGTRSVGRGLPSHCLVSGVRRLCFVAADHAPGGLGHFRRQRGGQRGCVERYVVCL